MTRKTRVLVVDDHPFFRSGIIQWLNLQSELSCCGEAHTVVTARQAAASSNPDVVLLDQATDTVLTAIQTVMRGEIYTSRPVAARMLQNLFPDPASTAPALARLSNREIQVFQMLGAGCGNKEIAASLNISQKTVETYRENLKHKLELPDATALIQAATRWVEDGRFEH